MVKKFEEFLNEQNINFSKFNFEPITWGVEDFDDEAEEDLGIPVTITRFVSGGRESIESYWKLYAFEDLGDSWNVKAICTEAEDRRYRKDDEVELEIYKDFKIWDLESVLKDKLDEEGF